jgi:hypothetical protein|tara:strand:+ start:301 stop:2070 length:1770 start_codon:yes stop_codon:yes gene_type:complete
MADEVKNQIVEDGQSTWANYATKGPYFYPRGALGRFFARFFATKAQDAVIQAVTDVETANLTGDTKVKSSDPTDNTGVAAFTINRTTPVYSEIERSRKERYKDYEAMDEYPEVGSAFDMYADDSTQKDTQHRRWSVKSDSPEVVKEIERLFETIQLDRFYYDVVRNTVKFGDCFLELIADINNPAAGVQRIKILNPNYLIRVEDNYGYLKTFLQQIPDNTTIDASYQSPIQVGSKNSEYIELDKNQIVHFRLFTSDPKFYPYGKSVAAYGVHTFRSLKLMEDAMLIYRLARAPERRIFYIDVGNLPSSKAELFMERIKEKFKKEKYFRNKGVDARYNPLAADEDYFVPLKGNQNTRIETLPGAQNLGEVTDVSYFRDKLLAALKVPKDFISQDKNQQAEKKANLSELDVKFARAVGRVQHQIEAGLEVVAKRHLALKNYPITLINSLRIQLPDPSDKFTKRKLEIDEMRLRIIQGVTQTQLFPKDHIYKEYYEMSEGEISVVKEQLRQEAEEAAYQQQELNQISPGAGDRPQGNTPGGQEAVPPQQAEEDFSELDLLRSKLVEENGYRPEEQKVWKRILQKIPETQKKA